VEEKKYIYLFFTKLQKIYKKIKYTLPHTEFIYGL